MAKITLKSAQDIQDDIFRKMTAEKKIQLTCGLSSFLLKLGQKNDGNRKIIKKNCRNSRQTKS